jgi:rhodanese-related sulfurtransferase
MLDPAANTSLFVSANALREGLMRANAPLVIDVRKPHAFDPTRMLPGAIRRSHENPLEALSEGLKGRTLAYVCVHGHEVSQGATRAARAAGWQAYALEGGVAAWFGDGHSGKSHGEGVSSLLNTGKASQWITRDIRNLSQIACPWLIRRYLDPLAQFLCVPEAEGLAKSKALNAEPFDVPGARFSQHSNAQGASVTPARSTFEALVKAFSLDDPVLTNLADIVHRLSSGNATDFPPFAGLTAISQGLSRLHPGSEELIEHGMPIYDALYAWMDQKRA